MSLSQLHSTLNFYKNVYFILRINLLLSSKGLDRQINPDRVLHLVADRPLHNDLASLIFSRELRLNSCFTFFLLYLTYQLNICGKEVRPLKQSFNSI